jgi:hypothetical protein
MRRLLTSSIAVLGSLRLSVALFGLLTLITWAGTIAQETIGLQQAQREYFESWLVFRRAGDLVLPVLPGGMSLITALFVNLLVGGLLRLLPRLRARAHGRARGLRLASGCGVAITHLGIAALLLACLAKYRLAEEGGIQLFEGQSTSEFVSYEDWEIVVHERIEAGLLREHLVPSAAFADRQDGRSLRLRAPGLPFELLVSDFAPHAEVRRGPAPPGSGLPTVDGFHLRPLAPQTEWERNVAGCLVRVLRGPDAEPEPGILWGLAQHPLAVAVDGRSFGIGLRRQRSPLPFRLQLDSFTHRTWPNTTIPREFASEVTLLDEGGTERRQIRMNEPLRRDGVVVYQASFGPAAGDPGGPRFSGLSVVRNPADAWPWYTLYAIATGMLLHFVARMALFVRDQRRALRGRST